MPVKKKPTKIKFKWKDAPVQEATIKEIHGLRYVCEGPGGDILNIYEDELVSPLTDEQYWAIVKEQNKQKKANEKNLLSQEPGAENPS
jgi:hypothetical protein